MVGMPHGGGPGVSVGGPGGPSAHALSHLNPSAHPQMFQQHQQQMAARKYPHHFEFPPPKSRLGLFSLSCYLLLSSLRDLDRCLVIACI